MELTCIRGLAQAVSALNSQSPEQDGPTLLVSPSFPYTRKMVGLLCADKKTYAGSYTYYGEENTVYYMVLKMYAERDGGSDYRLYTTNKCRA